MEVPSGEPLLSNTDYVLVPLTRGMQMAISPEDEERVVEFTWNVCKGGKTFYAKSSKGGSGRVYAHRFILNPPLKVQIDHWNRFGLDNRRCNIRLCTWEQQTRNVSSKGGSSRYKGVSFKEEQRKWAACIYEGGKNRHLGYFNCEIDAGLAYDKIARRLHGRFGVLNFPKPDELPPIPPLVILSQKPMPPHSGITARQNRKSRFVGVDQRSSGYFNYRIMWDGKLYTKSGFKTEEKAAHARDDLIKKMGWTHPLSF